MGKAVDYYSDFLLPDDSAAFMRCLKASGVDAIARYLTASMGDARQLTTREVADAHAAGLGVIFVFEMNPTYPGYFTFAQGVSDCQNAHARLIDLGAPVPSVVYFTVDTNIVPALTTTYFDGIESVAGDAVTVGGYGYERFVEYARVNFPNVGKHLWQTYGTPRGSLDLWQHEQLAMCGVPVDVDDATIEGWKPEGGNMAHERIGQSADLTLKPGETGGPVQAIYSYPELGHPNGVSVPQRGIKAKGTKIGRSVITIYPPVDPFADETLDLDADPTYIIVNVVP